MPETNLPSSSRPRGGPCFLVIGDNALASRICSRLERLPGRVIHLPCPDDTALGAAAAARPQAVAIALHDDVSALRYALAMAHLQPATKIVVTIFDRTIAARVRELLPQAVVTAAADVAAPVLVEACLDARPAAALGRIQRMSQRRSGGVADSRRRPARKRSRARDALEWITPSLRTHDSHTQLLLVGAVGLGLVLLTDWAWLTLHDRHPAIPAFLEAARVVATVGPGPIETTTAYAAFSAVAIVATMVLTAMFTAGLVQRLMEPGLLGIFGRRRLPRSDHVIVVGMGQVGIRLCAELRRVGIPVVGVERNPAAPQLRLARALSIPVVVGHGSDREGLERLRLHRSLALAAVGSNELDNIAVAVAASAVSPGTRIVLRAGEQEAIAETRSLLPLGTTTDVLHLAASFMAQAVHPGAEHETRPVTGLGPAIPGPSAAQRFCGHRSP